MNEENVVGIARGRRLRVSAQKARLVVDLIRGKDVGEAIEVLSFNPQKAARLVLKVLESAVANAEHNVGADVDVLVVSRAFVDEAPTLKRVRVRARFRMDRQLRRSCHVTVVVSAR